MEYNVLRWNLSILVEKKKSNVIRKTEFRKSLARASVKTKIEFS